MRSWLAWGTVALLGVTGLVAAAPAGAGSHRGDLARLDAPYDIGSPSLRTVWVDPVAGNDGDTGATRAAALRTLNEAWRRIPQGVPLTEGVHIKILPGVVGPDDVPNYLESRYGTRRAPIIIEGEGSVTLPALNIFDTRYLYLLGVTLSSRAGDAFHCERCDHMLIRDAVIRGAPADSGLIGDLVKVNQSQHIFIEDSDISGASDNAVDFVAVQYGVMRGNRIHDAQDWCAYAKGGSAYIRFESNEVFDCGTGAFTAGQGTGFQFMVPPWLQYEAYDVRIVNNVVHDVEGAAFGVNGGFAVLIAYNTAVAVGSRSHVMEFVAGMRSCDGQRGDPGRKRCARFLKRDGWGTTRVDDGDNFVRIPNRQVLVFNNLIVNPDGAGSQWQHLTVAAPFRGWQQRGSGVAVPTLFDEGLVISGNVIWNGPLDHASGLGPGCAETNPTCNELAFRRDNRVNTLRPQFVDAAGGDYRLADPGALAGIADVIPRFTWSGAPPGIPRGRLDTSVPLDNVGHPRSTPSVPGAYSPSLTP